jgi:chemotaxis protein methyltransferase CheR
MALAGRGVLDDVDLVATDVSRESIDRAVAGRHGARALRDVPVPALAARYLARAADGTVSVDARIRRAVEFGQLNLVDAARVRAMPPADFILCRNVLIYFSDATAVQVVQSLVERLRPGGALFVGISESLLRFGTSLECVDHGGVFLYRKGT